MNIVDLKKLVIKPIREILYIVEHGCKGLKSCYIPEKCKIEKIIPFDDSQYRLEVENQEIKTKLITETSTTIAYLPKHTFYFNQDTMGMEVYGFIYFYENRQVRFELLYPLGSNNKFELTENNNYIFINPNFSIPGWAK